MLGVAIAMRLPPLLAPPFLSSDLNRYIWDGRVQQAGINPYVYVPADPALASLRDDMIYPHVYRADYAPTIYPPMAQVIFAAIAGIAETRFAVKLTMLGFEALALFCVALALRRASLSETRLLIYAWNPVAAWAFAGNGHVDAAAIGFIGCALLARAVGRGTLAGAALAAATLVKFLPVAIAAALWRRWDWRLPAAFLIVAAALYGLYAGAGWKVLGFLPGYSAEEGLNHGGGFYLVAALGQLAPLPGAAGTLYVAAAGAALACLALRMALLSPPDPRPADDIRGVCGRAAVLGAAAMAALSPHYPWYFVWLALPSCITPYASVVFLSVAPLLLYLDPWGERFWWPSLIYVPFAMLAVLDWRRGLALGSASLAFTPSRSS